MVFRKIIDGVAGTASAGMEAVVTTVRSTSDFAVTAASNAANALSSSAYSAYESADALVLSARRSVADTVKGAGEQIGQAAGLGAECVTLVSTAGASYLLFAGLPYELANSAITGITGPLAQKIRGNKPECLGLHLHDPDLFDALLLGGERDIFAIFYMPTHKDADNNGVVKLSEVELFHLSRGPQSQEFSPAFIAVKQAKTENNLPLKSRAEHERIIAQNMASRLR